MLRVTSVSAKQAAAYYQAENNVSEKEAKNYSQWFGQGADRFNLKGKVNSNDFENLLNGKSPNGEQFRSRSPTQPEYQERAGLDLTFSAPKSVSLAVLVNEDQQLEQAHREAVNTALKTVEEKYASTRIRQNGDRNTVHTGNLAIAQFHHDRSRDNDPQLHTHAIVINATQNQNGDWYSLKNDEIFQNQKLLSSIYQNELAHKAKNLGYEIRQNDSGHFELEGYSDTQLKHFSKRRQEIVKHVGTKASAKQREIAALKTRQPKQKNISREELQADWQAQANQLGLVHPVPTNNQVRKNHRDDPKQLIDDAISHASEKQTSFKREDLEKFALKHLGNNSWSEIQTTIDNHQNLLQAKDNRLTTLSALNRELDTIRMVDRGMGKVERISSAATVKRQLQDKGLTEGQYNAVLFSSTSKDKITAWQGKAGAGKTYALNEFKAIAESQGYTIKGFAPSASAAKTLGDELGIKSNTVARQIMPDSRPASNSKFKQNKKLKQEKEKQIWIVDEAGLMSARDAHKLLQKADAEKARVLLVGDTRQLSSVGAGNPFKSLQKAGIKTNYLNQSLRQKTEDLKLAVEQISEGNLEAGIKTLDSNGRIEQIGDSTTRAKTIADDYMKLEASERDKTLILAGTHRDREEIVSQIRSRLQDENRLGKDHSSIKLKSQSLSAAEMNYVQNYEQGDILTFHRDYKKANLHKDELYKVKKVKQNSLLLESSTGIKREIDPAKLKQKSLYKTDTVQVAENDRLKWTQNNNSLGRRNGQEFWIDKIDENLKATIRYKDGKKDTIDLNKPQHFDHDLVNTTYSSQGKTANRVIVSASNDRTLSQESFYVAASRVKHDLKIYAQDKDSLLSKAQQSRSQQNPLDVLAGNPNQVSNRVEKNLRGVLANYLKQQKNSSPQQSKEHNKSHQSRDKIQERETVEHSPSRGMRL